MAIVQDALDIARTLLNDDLGLEWHDATLLPKVALAHGEMVSKLALNGISTQDEDSSWFTVLIGAISLGVNLPTDLLTPIKLYELPAGGDINNAAPMQKVEFLPIKTPIESLQFWTWKEGEIQFIGATTDRQVKMLYVKSTTAPKTVGATLYFPLSETYIGPRVAALCKAAKGDKAGYENANQIAELNLSKLVRAQVKSGQALPVRRRPFSATRRRFYL